MFYWYFSSEGGTSRTSSGGSRIGNSGNPNSQNDDSAANTSTDKTEKPVQHKWPIRPGVHVHVNGLHTLNNSVSAGASSGAGPTMNPAEKITGFSYGARNSGSGSSAGSSTANSDAVSNAGSSTTGNEDVVASTLNTKHKDVIARGTSTERNVPPLSEIVADSATKFSNTNQNSGTIAGHSSSNSNAKSMQGR